MHRLVQMSMFFKENKIFIFKICLFSIENTTKQMLVIFQKRREILIRQQFSAIQELDFRFFWQGGGGGEVFFFFFFFFLRFLGQKESI